MKGKVLKHIAQGYEDDETIFAYLLDRADIQQYINENSSLVEWIDENKMEITPEKLLDTLLTDDFVSEVVNYINEDDYLFERLSESYSDGVSSTLYRHLQELLNKERIEEYDQELWDTKEQS